MLRTRWAYVCGVIVLVSVLSVPLFAYDYYQSAKHFWGTDPYSITDGTDESVERHLHSGWAWDWPWMLRAWVIIGEGNTENIGRWAVYSDAISGEEWVDELPPWYDQITTLYYADQYVAVDTSVGASACGLSTATFDILQDGVTVAWEWTYLWVTQEDSGTRTGHCEHWVSGSEDPCDYFDGPQNEAYVEHIVDGQKFSDSPTFGAVLDAYAAGVLIINDADATGEAYGDVAYVCIYARGF